MSVCTLGEHGNFLWFQSSPGARLRCPGNRLSLTFFKVSQTCVHQTINNHCRVSDTAVYVSYIPHVWLSLPGVVLLRERDQGHAVRIQAFHARGRPQDLLFPPCRAMVRTPPSTIHTMNIGSKCTVWTSVVYYYLVSFSQGFWCGALVYCPVFQNPHRRGGGQLDWNRRWGFNGIHVSSHCALYDIVILVGWYAFSVILCVFQLFLVHINILLIAF